MSEYVLTVHEGCNARIAELEAELDRARGESARLYEQLELRDGEIRLWKRTIERMREQRTAGWDWHLPPVAPMPAKYDTGDVKGTPWGVTSSPPDKGT